MTDKERIAKLKALVEKMAEDYCLFDEPCRTDEENLEAAADLCEWKECGGCGGWIRPGTGQIVQTEPTVMHPADRAYPGDWETWCEDCCERDEP